MIAKDGQPTEPNSESNYEAAVLDFLDKEMANVQSTLTEEKQSEELDALVADLLHQVITESDQAQSGEMIVTSEDMNDLIAEFVPQQETISPPEVDNPSPESVQTENLPLADEKPPVPETVEKPQIKDPETKASAVAVFASAAALKSKMPVIAAAAVCILAVIGIAVYYFSNSSGKASKPDTYQAAAPVRTTTTAATPTVQKSVQQEEKPKASQAVPPTASKKSTPADKPKEQAPVIATQRPPVAQTVTPPATGVISPVNPTPAKEEKAPEPQVVQSAPPVVPNPVPEKPAPPVVTENQAPPNAIPERNPVQQPTTVAAKADNASPITLPQVTAPVVQRSLVPAVAIAQVSPKYPEIALRTRASATVVLELDVDKQGKVIKATPVSGPEMFHREAINAAMQWRYKPASLDGANISSKVKVTFNFKLNK